MDPATPVPIDLPALARARDGESRDVFVSLYVDLADERAQDAVARRAREIRSALPDEAARERFDAALEAAQEGVAAARRDGEARGAAAFASPLHDFRRVHALRERVPTRLVLDSSPFVRPLARFVDEREPFALALLDGERAVVYVVDAEGAEKAGSQRMSLIGRHKKGGMSQMRYQRHRQGRVEHLLDEVVALLERLHDEGEASRLVLAGPGQAKRHLEERLSPRLREVLVGVEDADFRADSDDDLVARFARLARAQEAEASREAVDTLRQELLKGELAMTGPFDVVRAARDGRVALLLVLKDAPAGARKCEAHEAYFEADARCPAGGEEGTVVDLPNEAVEHALRSDARIEFVADDAFLRDAGGVAALLRW